MTIDISTVGNFTLSVYSRALATKRQNSSTNTETSFSFLCKLRAETIFSSLYISSSVNRGLYPAFPLCPATITALFSHLTCHDYWKVSLLVCRRHVRHFPPLMPFSSRRGFPLWVKTSVPLICRNFLNFPPSDKLNFCPDPASDGWGVRGRLCGVPTKRSVGPAPQTPRMNAKINFIPWMIYNFNWAPRHRSPDQLSTGILMTSTALECKSQ